MTQIFLYFCYCIVNLPSVMILLIILFHLVSFGFDKLVDFIDDCYLNGVILLFLFVRFDGLILSFFNDEFSHCFAGYELLSDRVINRRCSCLGSLYCAGGLQFQWSLVICWVVQNIFFIFQAFVNTLAYDRYSGDHMFYLFHLMLFLWASLGLIIFKANYDQGTDYQHCK